MLHAAHRNNPQSDKYQEAVESKIEKAELKSSQ